MALKTDLSDMSISSIRASIAKVNVTLKCWGEADNTITADPVLEKTVTENNVKIFVQDQTPEQLAARIKEDIKTKSQGEINYYQNEQGKIDTVTSAFQNMVTEVDGELTGELTIKELK